MLSNEMYSNTSGLNAQVRFSSSFSRLGSETSFIGIKKSSFFSASQRFFQRKLNFVTSSYVWFVLVAIESRCLCFTNRDYTTTCQACRRLLIRLDQYLCVTTILWRWVRSSALCRWGTMRLRTGFFRLRWWEWDHHRHITQKNLRTQNSTCQNFNRSTHRWWVCLHCYWVQSCRKSWKSLLIPMLHLFDQKSSKNTNIVKCFYNFK